MEADNKSATEDKTNSGKPLVVSVISIVIFFLGSVGLLLGIVAGIELLLLPIDLPSFNILAIMFWCVAGPCLILAGYNLWKRKKWAAQLAALIVGFDLVSALISRLLSPLSNIDMGDVLVLILDIATLALIVAAWKHLQ